MPAPRIVVVLAAAACSSSNRPSHPSPELVDEPAPRTTPRVVDAYCPYGLLSGYPWAREVYPGCAPPPFMNYPITCAPECPTPCRGTDIAEAKYDARGRLTYWRAAAATEPMVITYDGDRLARWEQAGSAGLTFEYLQGRLVQSKGENGIDARYTYNAQNNVIAIDDRALGSVSLSYDRDGRLVEVEGVNKQVLAYDASGRLATVTHGGQPDVAYTYDADGLLVKLSRQQSGDTFALEYDARRRPIAITTTHVSTTSNQTSTHRATYEYDCP